MVNCIMPDISILEEEFNFEGVTTFGRPGELKMTLVNKSNLILNLYLDLRNDEYGDYECLNVINLNENLDDDVTIFGEVEENEVENEEQIENEDEGK